MLIPRLYVEYQITWTLYPNLGTKTYKVINKKLCDLSLDREQAMATNVLSV